jgi:hypothetical protein
MITGVQPSVIYGLCPGCQSWQIESPDIVSLREAIPVVEDAMREHAFNECPRLLGIWVDRVSSRPPMQGTLNRRGMAEILDIPC